MRVLNCGRFESFMKEGWKFHTAASTERVTSPVSEFLRSRTIGTTWVGAIEYDGFQSR